MAILKCGSCGRVNPITVTVKPMTGLGSCCVIHCGDCGNIFGVLPNIDIESTLKKMQQDISLLKDK